MWLGLIEKENSVASMSCAFCNVTIPWIFNKMFSCHYCNARYCSKEHKRSDGRYHRFRCRGMQTAGEAPSGAIQAATLQTDPQANLFPALGPSTEAFDHIEAPDFSTASPFALAAGANYMEQYIPTISPPKPLLGDTTVSYTPDITTLQTAHTSTTVNQIAHSSRQNGNSLATQTSINTRPIKTSIESNQAVLNLDTSGTQRKLSLKDVSEFVVNSLNRHNHCILDNFNGTILANSILEEVKELYYRGAFSDGQVSSTTGPEGATNRDVREDKVVWVNGEPHSTMHRHMVHMDKLMAHCNGYLQGVEISKRRTQAMIACYPGGGTGYKEHVDNPHKDGRCITTLYYVNPGWNSEEDGGVLTLFPNNSRPPVNVEPCMDRLLMFWSDRRTPHRVNPAYKTRFAITLWYFDQKERESYINRIMTEQQQKRL